MRVNIKYISLLSAFKMGCAFTLVIMLLLGIPYITCTFAGLLPLMSITTAGALRGIPGILTSGYVLIILVGILGAFSVAISWTLAAFFFNVAAWLTGGLNVKLKRRGRKSTELPIDDDEEDNPVIRAAGKNLDKAEAFLDRRKRKLE